jgi:hypothetical protein
MITTGNRSNCIALQVLEIANLPDSAANIQQTQVTTKYFRAVARIATTKSDFDINGLAARHGSRLIIPKG